MFSTLPFSLRCCCSCCCCFCCCCFSSSSFSPSFSSSPHSSRQHGYGLGLSTMYFYGQLMFYTSSLTFTRGYILAKYGLQRLSPLTSTYKPGVAGFPPILTPLPLLFFFFFKWTVLSFPSFPRQHLTSVITLTRREESPF